MPELPEVETIVRGLRPRLAGRQVVRVEVRQPDVVKSGLGRFRRGLRGARIERVGRRGKYIVLELRSANGFPRKNYLVVHLGMTGRLYACGPRVPRLKHTHVLARLSSGEEVRYVDPRRFGRMAMVAESDLADYFAALGPEPLRVSREGFRAICAGRRAPIKNLLLNQSRLRGVGNIYANESLFAAGIHPARPAGEVSPRELEKLWRALRAVLRAAIAEQGTTVADYRTSDGEPGGFQNRLQVYDREGEPCPRCGTPIKRLVLGGRSAHFCPTCQPKGR